MTFRSAYLKLTAFYVLIVMIVSLSFSLVLYRISSHEIGQGLGQQTRFFSELPSPIQFLSNDELEEIRLDQLRLSNNRLKLNLIYFNLLILILSSGASYFLAKRTLQPIEEMVDAQNRFTADASHELRTPLTAMKTEIEVSLRDNNISISDAKDQLKSNLEEIGKMESLSSALLKLAQYREDSIKTLSFVELAKVVESSIRKVQKIAEQKDIEIEGKIKKLSVMGDKSSLVELLVILLDNAIKYSPRKSTVNIEIIRTDKSALIKVSDCGIGIKASDLPHIFDRFYRADLSRSKERIDGFGLGLSIAKRIVKLHKGEISVASKAGEGAIFKVKLPL